jgi:hypothetical protein
MKDITFIINGVNCEPKDVLFRLNYEFIRQISLLPTIEEKVKDCKLLKSVMRKTDIQKYLV